MNFPCGNRWRAAGRRGWASWLPWLAALLLLAIGAGSASARTCTSTGNGNWVSNNWSGGCTGASPPVAGDTVSIGHTITIAANAAIDGVTITSGGLLRYGSGGSFKLTVGTGGLTINNGGTISVQVAASGTHTRLHSLAISGGIANAGTLTFRATAGAGTRIYTVDTSFSGTGTKTISGAGSFAFHIVSVHMGSINDVVDIATSTFAFTTTTTPTGTPYLCLQQACTGGGGASFTAAATGTFKVTAALTFAPFDNATFSASPDDYIINTGARFWLANSSAIVNFQTPGAAKNMTLQGTLQIDDGTFNLGGASGTASQRLRFNSSGAPVLLIGGGNLNIAGRLTSIVTSGAIGTFTMTGGTMTVGMVGNADATYGSVALYGSTTVNLSGGTIVLSKPTTGGAVDYRLDTANLTVNGSGAGSGGTLQVGNASTLAASTFTISTTNVTQSTTPTIGNLVVNTTNSPTAQLNSAVNVYRDITINSGGTLKPQANQVYIGSSNSSSAFANNSGSATGFTAGTSTVNFVGTAATGSSTIGGSTSTTFYNLTLNKTGSTNLTVNSNPTISNTMTFSSGDALFGTGTKVIFANGATSASSSATSHVVATPGSTSVQKIYAPSASMAFTFPLGDGTNYLPVAITSGTANAACPALPTGCTLDASVTQTNGEHPNIGSSIIDSAADVNRYWRLTQSGTLLAANTTYGATFTFPTTTIQDDSGAASFSGYDIEGWDGANWYSTTNTGRANTSTSATIGGFGDFIIGETKSTTIAGNTILLASEPFQMNAFDTGTGANALLGYIGTKVAGQAFSLDVIQLNTAKTGYDSTSISNITLDLMDASNDTGVFTNGCRAGWTLGQAGIGAASATISSGRSTVNNLVVNNTYRVARIRVMQGGTVKGCSTDAFAVRPASLATSGAHADWATTGTTTTLNSITATAGPVHKAGTAASSRPFTLLVSPQPTTATNYNSGNNKGAPTEDAAGVTCFALATTCTNGTLTSAGLPPNSYSWAASGSAGALAVTDANYSEAGVFYKRYVDTTFADVDIIDGTSAATRKIDYTTDTGCASTATNCIGRFVPDNLLVTVNTPAFQSFCATGTRFTYIGQPFNYASGSKPTVTVTARNAANATTTNYRENAWRFTLPSANNMAIASHTMTNSVGGACTHTADTPTGNGSRTYTLSLADANGCQVSRGTPEVPFTGNISFTISSVKDGNETGNCGAGSCDIVDSSLSPANTVTFDGGGSGISFTGGNTFRYGRLRLSNAIGSELLNLPVPMQTQFWNSTGTAFVTNTDDSCTSLVTNNIKLTSPPAGVTAVVGGAFSSGVGSLTLTKPTTPAKAAVDLCVDLGSDPGGGTVCSATSSAGLTHLQGLWAPGSSYDNDPTARATFGVYRGANEFIYIRENY